jgi:hypothetical protein
VGQSVLIQFIVRLYLTRHENKVTKKLVSGLRAAHDGEYAASFENCPIYTYFAARGPEHGRGGEPGCKVV